MIRRRSTSMGVVALLDTASAAAWECHSRAEAISMARFVLNGGRAAASAAAFGTWRRSVGCADPATDLVVFLNSRFRDQGDVGLSLTRAAVMVQLELEAPSRSLTYLKETA